MSGKLSLNSIARLCSVFALIAAMLSAWNNLHAQEAFPARPIRLVVGFAPGGVTDLSARVFGEFWGPQLATQVIVENKPGAGGVVAVNGLTRTAPDGYELVWTSSTTQVILPILDPGTLSYDPSRDFQAVAFATKFDLVLVTSAATGIRTFKELVSRLRARKEPITFVSVGSSAPPHLAAAVLASMAGGKAEAIPYKSGPQGHTDLVAGRVTYGFVLPSLVEAQVKSGKLYALVMAAPQRSKILPDVPTAAEAGLPEFLTINWSNWNGVFAPAKTPPAVIEKLHAAAARVIANPDFAARLEKLGVDTMPGFSLKETSNFVREELVRWRAGLKKAGIQPQ